MLLRILNRTHTEVLCGSGWYYVVVPEHLWRSVDTVAAGCDNSDADAPTRRHTPSFSGLPTSIPEGLVKFVGPRSRGRETTDGAHATNRSPCMPDGVRVSAVYDGDNRFAEGRRQERRRYIEGRAARTAVPGRTKNVKKPWTVDEAKIALNLSLTVPQAALQIGRTASAVESLRQRWRKGRLPDALSVHIPAPRKEQQ